MATRIREKAAKIKEEKDMRPHAIVKYQRICSSKVRIVLDNIRGKKVEDAVAILANATQKAAEICLKLLNSAIANAENNRGINKQDLKVAECYACPGPMLKRVNFRARGRSDRKLERTSHITIILDEIK